MRERVLAVERERLNFHSVPLCHHPASQTHDSLLNPTGSSLCELHISNSWSAMQPWLPTAPRKPPKVPCSLQDHEALTRQTSLSWSQHCLLTFHYYFFTYQAFDSGFYLAPVLKMGCSSLCCLVLPSSSPLWYFSHFWKHILPMITKPHPYADILLQQSISWDLFPCILTFPRCIESLRAACRLASCGFSLLLLTRRPNAFTTCE